jgi:hypothetical protein
MISIQYMRYWDNSKHINNKLQKKNYSIFFLNKTITQSKLDSNNVVGSLECVLIFYPELHQAHIDWTLWYSIIKFSMC